MIGSARDAVVNRLARTRYFRGKYRILNHLTPAQGIRNTRVFDYEMALDLCEYVQRRMYLGSFEPGESALLCSYLRPGMTFFDVGANVGYYTALAAACVGPTGRVVAYEPSLYAFEKLLTFVTLNGISQVRCVQAALSKTMGSLQLFVPPESHHSHDPSVLEYCADMTRIDVPAVTLDGERQRLGHDQIDALKLDVEGHEWSVLEGSLETIRAGKLRAMLCEFNDNLLSSAGMSSPRLYSQVVRLGFRDVEGEPATFRGCFNRFFVFRGCGGPACRL